MPTTQFSRIDSLVRAESPPPLGVTLRFGATNAPRVLERIKDVMRQVALAQRSVWHEDETWRTRLPEWFLQSFEDRDLSELMRNPDLWDFGSWLDAIRSPGWEWWSSDAKAEQGVVRCQAHSSPYAIEPLLYVIRVAGGTDVEVAEE